MKALSDHELGWVLAIFLAFALRALLALSCDLYFDEAYYWVWSRHLAGGYFDHAPMIAWLIALVGPRPAALGCGALTAAVVFALARSVYGDRERALQATAVWCAAVPVSTLAGVFATPDAPLVLFWSLSLWAILRERPLALGLTGGLALLSKYSSALLVPVHALDALLRRKWPWRSLLSAAVAALLFLPPVLWNLHHAWAGFRFQLHHGLGGGGGLRSLAEFVGGQLLLGGPVVCVWGAVWLVKGPREQRLLRLATAVPLLAFAVASLRARGEANWAAIAYPSLAVAMGMARPRWALAAVASGLLLLAASAQQMFKPFVQGAALTPYVRTHGWSSLSRLKDEGFSAVIAPSYELASEAAYYSGLPTWVDGATRPTQYDFWPRPEVKDSVAFISEGAGPSELLRARFDFGEPEIWSANEHGLRIHTFKVWRAGSPR